MDTAHRIREAMASVAMMRHHTQHDVALATAIRTVKRFQARRFKGTYSDLLRSPIYEAPARFFLDELYGDQDFADRDAQFARIAGAVGTLFPEQVAQTAASLAELHALTEALDHDVARAWAAQGGRTDVARYAMAWKAAGRRSERQHQLERVVRIGHELVRLTRLPGIRLMLRMMRGPAAAAGMGALQQFLERGFDTFSALSRRNGLAEGFLQTVCEREQRLLELLFDGELVACETELDLILGQAR